MQNKQINVFVVGSGKLANTLLTSNLSLPLCNISKWESKFQNLEEKAIVIHAGSGRQLEECFKFCSRTKSVFIELATGLKTEKEKLDFPLIICHNTSIFVLKTLSILNAFGRDFNDYEISIIESHQSAKATEPATAYAFADSLKYPKDKIVSIRNNEIQRDIIRIPEEYLNKHAYHKISIRDGNEEIIIETKVLGHDSYAKGVKKIIEVVLKSNLENRKYTVLEII